MSWSKAFLWFAAVSGMAGFATGPVVFEVGDAFMLTFSGAAALAGTMLFLVMRLRGGNEVCRLDLPPGPPAAGRLTRAA